MRGIEIKEVSKDYKDTKGWIMSVYSLRMGKYMRF